MEHMMEIAVRVNSLLTAYIVIHDDIFGSSIRKFIPIPGIFKKTDYCQHTASLAQISSALRICEADAIGQPSDTKSQSYAATVLIQYIHALTLTVVQLERITNLLCQKAQGKHSYSLVDYNRDCDRYNDLVQEYTTLGESLNDVVRGR